jgi:ABC-type branched-subunit amino acid transport system ATPase component
VAEPLLRAEKISKRFGGIAAVDGVDLDLHAGEIHAVIGPNGAGKSTLLATLAGDLAPNGGRVFLDNSDVTPVSLRKRTRRGIGRTYQHSAVIAEFTALDMVRLAALRAASRTQWRKPLARLPEVTRRAREALASVGLSDRESITAAALTHGERRRLEIASVLALGPRILLLDEPLAGLGRDESAGIVSLVSALRRACAVMLVEHDIDVVFAVADRITVLHQGRVIASGSPAAVRAHAAVQEAYLGRDGA